MSGFLSFSECFKYTLIHIMRKIIFFLFLFFTFCLQAQVYNFARLDNTDGLSNNQIESIFKDSRGFMWFGTNFGLNRYDGYEVKVYKSEKADSASLKYNSIPEIEEDAFGRLWIKGAPDYVVYSFSTEKFSRNLSEILKPYGINFNPALVEIDANKNFYFYQTNVGIFKYDIKQKKLFSFLQNKNPNSLSAGTIAGLRVYKGCFWVLFQNGLVERFNEQTNSVDFRSSFVSEKSIGSFIPKNLFVDNEGCPWIFPGIGDAGVSHYDFEKSEWVYFGRSKTPFSAFAIRNISSDIVRDVVQDKTGKIWIATDHGGINIYDKKSESIAVLLNNPMNPNTISQNSTISLFCDNDGIVWVGTFKNGVSYYHPGMFKFEKSPLFFYQHAGLENKDCNSLYEDTRGNLWIGTNGNGLLKYDGKRGDFKIYRNDKNDPSSISSDIVISSIEDKQGNMWFGTFLGGLNLMQGDKFKRFASDVSNPNSLSNMSVFGLAEDANENLWIGTLGGGVDRLDKTRTIFEKHHVGSTSQANFVLSLHNSGSSIFISTSQGVGVLNTSNGTIEPVFKDRELESKLTDLVVYNTFYDSRRLLWIATDNGINIYNAANNSIAYINASNGLPSEQVVSFLEDNKGDIWVGTRNGLASVTCRKNKNGTYRFSVFSFDENDGLVNTSFNQNAVFKNSKGELYFGGTKGYVKFNPDNIRFNTIVPVPRFTSLYIGTEEIIPGKKFHGRQIVYKSMADLDEIVLNYNENNFTVKFSALSYIHPEKNRYRYMLKGLDNDWIEPRAGIGSVSYSSLAHGVYELVVYASNNDNVWSKEPLVLRIVIKPPFWLAWWAITFYVLMALFAVWLIVYYNLRKQKRQFETERQMREARQVHEMDEMKFRFFTNISHEFRTPLTLIVSPVEKLMQMNRTDEERNLLDIIQRNANGLLDLVNQLLDFRKLDVKKDTLNLSVGDAVSFIKDICYSFTDLANRKSINFSFSTSISELRIEFDPEKMRKVVYNLLSNAFKFTNNSGRIEVSVNMVQQIDFENQFLKITIADTGLGIPAKDIEKIFERFYRVENPGTGHQTGTGVGLHIASEYVKLHGGQISVESTEGKGSVFTVLIPAKQYMVQEIMLTNNNENMLPDTTEKILDAENELHGADEKKNKLPLMLIVDDNADFRNFITTLFISQYRVITAENGEKAYKIVLDKMPDLILSDVMMPVMDGFEFCRKLKQDIRVSHIPVIMLTAKTGDENKYIGLESGAEDYISKPFNMEMLSLKVTRIIERQRKIQEHFKKRIDINPSEIEITSMDEKFVKKAVALVELNIDNADFLVEDLCREMAMSRVYFYKKILSLTNKTPSEFIRFIRLKRAADLLERSQLYVNEVAFQVGFNDPKYFRKYFKEEFGYSPNEYKKKFEK
ncbi:MAG: hypothetical protein H6Q20_1014 [Bacteroidetes bacterium]|nr:hypothetical protein [Bacteroidota bacterium]